MSLKGENCGSRLPALIPRTAALVILFYQLRLFASELADTPFFIAAMIGALASAIFLCQRKVKPLQALIVLALVPWVIRLFVALPRWFIPGASGNSAILLDSLLLNLDRNNFTALLPFYWIAVTTYFSRRSRVFLRADIIAADIFFLFLFGIAPSASMEAYRWPILMIALFTLVLFLQILSLVLSTAPELKLRRKEGMAAGCFLFLLVFLGGALFIRPFQERAVEKGGGLLEPKLFRFDFSQILRLESEISVSDDLVLIVKKDADYTHTLLRRYTLSGYSPKDGFFRLDDIDEAAHPQRLPGRSTLLPTTEIANYAVTDQEYYLVNFDASAFIGMNMPVQIIPFQTWDASSFSSAYAVKSHTSEAYPFELIDAVRGAPGPENLGLSAGEYALYTDYGEDQAIASFAREITRGTSFYWDQIQMVYERLKYGEYRYSLKPGIAPDGDQLKFFLFNSKKGYCSYYAFAFTLLLRSLGIPCRVAAGFFVDPMEETFNYYPVRTDMAHAWVEVWFPGYGWIEYDPTTETTAEGEEFRFSQGTPAELFERLMKEILENRSRLRVKEGNEAEGRSGDLAALGKRTIRFFIRNGPLIAAAALVILFLAIRSIYVCLSRFSKHPRKKALYLWAHTKRRLALAGLGNSRGAGHAVGEAEWAKANDNLFSGLYSLYLDSAAARFAPAYTSDDCQSMTEHYRVFSAEYRKALPVRRRLLAWLLPPLALIAGPAVRRSAEPESRAKISGTLLLIILIFLLRGEFSQAQDGPPQTPDQRADFLYENASAAQRAENWERAIELLGEGCGTYPDDSRFPRALGNLYYHRKLYRLAWDEYRRAEKIIPWDPELLHRLAYTAGYLNRNEASADYLKKVLTLQPDNREAIGSLAWMYFKLHRLSDGEQLLLDAMERLGSDEDFAMTLGTIYSDMFRYEDAKGAYLKAIRGAEITGIRLTAALAHYNLSILESRFYQYSLAYDRTNASLAAMNRASGRLARGELYLRRLELSRALEEYQEAYGMDSSPLSKLNLAEAFLIGGRLTEAMLYAEDCLKAGDQSWMLNYGIDPVRYKRDIHRILKGTYEGLLSAEAFSAPADLKERTQSLFRAVSYRFRAAVHRHLFSKYSLIAANAYPSGDGSGKINIEALIQYFNAYEVYPRRALAYLRQARDFEEPLIPDSAPSYDSEEGRMLGNRKILTETLGMFDPLWERDKIATVYAQLALKGNRTERQDAAERLFALNRGALLQNGIKLPVDLRITGDAVSAGGVIKRAVKAAGMEPIVGLSASPRYTLTITADAGAIAVGQGSVSCELYDGGRGIIIFRKTLRLSSASGYERAAFARALREGVFSAF